MPLVNSSRAADRSNCGNINNASCEPETLDSASSIVIRFSSTNCPAIRNAAAAVRLPTLVCSIHNLPRSMVNSMSHRSAVMGLQSAHHPGQLLVR